MMKTTKIMYDGCLLEVPVMPNGEPLQIPHNGFAEFTKTYCGPGPIGDALVSDKIFGVPMNVPCFIHDITNALAEDREEDHQSNVMFRENMNAVIKHLEPKPAWEDKYHHARYYRAITYYAAVDTLGLRNDE